MTHFVSLSGVFIASVHKIFNISGPYPLEGAVQVMELLFAIKVSFHRPQGDEVIKLIFRTVCSLRNLLKLFREKFQTVIRPEDGCRATFRFHHDN
jgi:hypothetical protein